MLKKIQSLILFLLLLAIVFLALQAWSLWQKGETPALKSAQVMAAAAQEALSPDQFRVAGFVAQKRIQEGSQTENLQAAPGVVGNTPQEWAVKVLQTEIHAAIAVPTQQELDYYREVMWQLFWQAAPEFLRELSFSLLVSLVLSAWGSVFSKRRQN